MASFKPTAAMVRAAKRGLLLRQKYNKGGTAVGVARARDIANGKSLPLETVKRVHSFFSRHAGNETGGEDDAGYISYLLWGGGAGKKWARGIVNQAKLKKAQRYFGGKKRSKLKDSDFVFPSVRAFPVMTRQDVRDAVSSFGRSRFRDQFGTFKKRLISLARRKGLLDAIPAKWKREMIQKDLMLTKEFRVNSLAKGFEVGENMYLFGMVLQPEVVDSQGHILSKEVIKKAAREHVAAYRGVGLRHKQMVTSNDVILTQSFINDTGEDVYMHGIRVPDGGWAVEHQVLNPQIKQLVKSGYFSGYSVGGDILKTSKC